MKPPPFDYHAPDTVDEALALLDEAGDEARPLAGGQSLIPLMSLRLARPAVLVDLNGIDELRTLAQDDGTLAVGAMVTHRTVERSDLVRRSVPLLAEAATLIGHPAIRTRGTVGGSLAHADPAAELPAVALVTGATFTARSKARGERAISAEEFFQGYFSTALGADEVLTSVRFPVAAPSTGAAFEEVSRRHGDFAMVGAAASVTLDGGRVASARVALINVADRPHRATEAESVVTGQEPSATLFAEAGQAAAGGIDPSDDLHASAAYRRSVAAVLVRRALEKAAQRAGGAA